MHDRFKIISYSEGISLFMLFFIAMPLKYGAGYALPVTVVGTIHGVLFIVFLFATWRKFLRERWPLSLLFFALVSSSVPFGMIALDRRLGSNSRSPTLTS